MSDTSSSRWWILPLVVLGLTATVVGVLSGIVWPMITDLPSYTVQKDGGASTSERGLTRFIAGDVTYCAIGLVAGIGIGIVAWRGFGRRSGWICVPIAMAAALLSAVLCWRIGVLVDPHDFNARLTAAQVGDVLPIDIRLHAVVAVVVWVFGACFALLMLTAILPDRGRGRPVHLPWSIRE